MRALTMSGLTFAQHWKRLRRSPGFPYFVFLLLFLTAICWQVYQYWWGVQLQRWLVKRNGSATRISVFPAAWKKRIGPGYLEPFEPVTSITLIRYPKMTTSLWKVPPMPAVTDPDPLLNRELRALKWLPFLKSMRVFGLPERDHCEALCDITSLRALDVGNFHSVARIGQLKRLEELTIALHGSTSLVDTKAIAAMPSLRTLRLQVSAGRPQGRFGAIPETLENQMRELARSRTIKRLEIQSPRDEVLLALTERLPNGDFPLINLSELRLSDNTSSRGSVTNAGLGNLHNLPNLVHLDLCHSNVDNAGLEKLQAIPKLRTLYLAYCKGMTDEGAEQLAQMTGLESLNVANTGLTAAGLSKLGPLRQLRSLRLSTQSQVTPELRRELSATCKINTR